MCIRHQHDRNCQLHLTLAEASWELITVCLSERLMEALRLEKRNSTSTILRRRCCRTSARICYAAMRHGFRDTEKMVFAPSARLAAICPTTFESETVFQASHKRHRTQSLLEAEHHPANCWRNFGELKKDVLVLEAVVLEDQSALVWKFLARRKKRWSSNRKGRRTGFWMVTVAAT